MYLERRVSRGETVELRMEYQTIGGSGEKEPVPPAQVNASQADCRGFESHHPL